jgi:S1-C subfamily serine protease
VGENATVDLVFPRYEKGRVIGERTGYLRDLERLRVRGTVLRSSKEHDLALLRADVLPEQAQALPLCEYPANPGDEVHGLGNRYDTGVLWTYATGVVRSRAPLPQGYFSAGQQLTKGATVLTASVPINEGDSGGPLINDAGQLVGVAAAIPKEIASAGYFIDVSHVRALLGIGASSTVASSEQLGPRAALHRQRMNVVAVVEYPGGNRRAGVLIDRSRRWLITTADAVAKETLVDVLFPVVQETPIVAMRWYRQEKENLRKKNHLVRGVVLGSDPRRNLALVELSSIPSSASVAPLVCQEQQPGEMVSMISHPLRVESLWVHGSASVRQRDRVNVATEGETLAEVLLLQCPLSEGEAGGPVFDAQGKFIALLTGRVAPQQQIAYALTAHEIRDWRLERDREFAALTSEDLLRRGVLMARAGEFLEAEKNLINAGDMARLPRAELWLRLGKSKQALAEVEAALKEKETANALGLRAQIRLALGEGKQALRDADRAVALDGKSAIAWASRAAVHLAQGKTAEAIKDCDEAIWHDARSVLAYRLRGQARANLDRSDEALHDLSAALAVSPGDVETLVARATVLLNKPDARAALEDCNSALRYQPTSVIVQRLKAQALLGCGQSQAGLALLNEILTRDAGNAEARLARGGELLRRGEFQAGAKDLATALSLGKVVWIELEQRLEQAIEEYPANAAEAMRIVLSAVDRAKVREWLKEAATIKDDRERAKWLRDRVRLLRGE